MYCSCKSLCSCCPASSGSPRVLAASLNESTSLLLHLRIWKSGFWSKVVMSMNEGRFRGSWCLNALHLDQSLLYILVEYIPEPKDGIISHSIAQTHAFNRFKAII